MLFFKNEERCKIIICESSELENTHQDRTEFSLAISVIWLLMPAILLHVMKNEENKAIFA